MTIINKIAGVFCIGILLLTFSGCKKGIFEPSIEGTWIEIDSIRSERPKGCELVINKEAGEVSLCGFKFVHPNNVSTITTRSKSKLIIKNGQMCYRQKHADIVWLASIAREDLYFMDYEFEGKYLWIIGDDSPVAQPAKGVGRLFKKE